MLCQLVDLQIYSYIVNNQNDIITFLLLGTEVEMLIRKWNCQVRRIDVACFLMTKKWVRYVTPTLFMILVFVYNASLKPMLLAPVMPQW